LIDYKEFAPEHKIVIWMPVFKLISFFLRISVWEGLRKFFFRNSDSISRKVAAIKMLEVSEEFQRNSGNFRGSLESGFED
jgi:hypothetical protein